MGYLVVVMLLAFFFGGIALLVEGVRLCMRRWTARDRMLKLPGTILQVHREYRRPQSPRSGRRRPYGSNYVNFPVIRFRTPSGQEVDFRSETGDKGTPSRFRVGQRLEVLYDPDGEVSPLINSWSGVWFGPIGMVFASVVFVGSAVICSILFRDRILDTTVLGSLYEMIATSE